MPRSCSSGLESRYLILPASLGEMMPLVAMRASVSDVLPWSTWARMQIWGGGQYGWGVLGRLRRLTFRTPSACCCSFTSWSGGMVGMAGGGVWSVVLVVLVVLVLVRTRVLVRSPEAGVGVFRGGRLSQTRACQTGWLGWIRQSRGLALWV